MKDMSSDDRKAKRLSRCDDDDGPIFGGHPPPKLDTPYTVTVKDKKDAYHAICMMKVIWSLYTSTPVDIHVLFMQPSLIR